MESCHRPARDVIGRAAICAERARLNLVADGHGGEPRAHFYFHTATTTMTLPHFFHEGVYF